MTDASQAVVGTPVATCTACGQPVDPDAPVRATEVHFHLEGRPWNARELLNAMRRSG